VAAGALAVSVGVGTVAAGAGAATAVTPAGSAGGVVTVVVAEGAADAAAAGALVVSAGVGIVAAGTAAASGGGMAVSAGALIEPAGAAAAAAQCSEIMFSEVAAKALSAAPDVAVPLAFCPMRVTSWPRCGFRSTLVVVILKLWPVLSSTNV